MTRRPPRDARIPAVVVSGFLGAGKTTLVRNLLDDARRTGLRLAVISNEFGALGIDQSLLAASDDGSAAYVELAGGCVCCQLSNDLLDTLQRLREEVDPDRIVIETSGVALPSETLLNFYRDPVRSWVSDDIGVVVVNAEQILDGRDLEGTFEDQLTSADVIVLNKIDLVPSHALPEVERRLRAIEPDAPIVQAEQADVDPRLLFVPGPGTRRRAPIPHTHEHFESEEIAFADGTSAAAVEDALRRHDALRAKGFVVTDSGLCLVQGVGRRIHFEPVDSLPRPDLRGRVVVIRRGSQA